MRLALLILILACLNLAGAEIPGVFTTNRTMRSLSLDECVRMALQHNLRIQVRRFDPNINRYQYEASRGIYDPVFSFEYRRAHENQPGSFNPASGIQESPSTTDQDRFLPEMTGVLPTGLQYAFAGNFRHNRGEESELKFDNYHADAAVQLEQPLLKNFWTDPARTTIQINRYNIQISEFALEEEIRAVVRDVQLSYFELLFAREDVKVQEKALELANKLVSDNNAKVRNGKLAPLDARQAESQAATTLSDLIQAQRRVLAAESNLKNLITDKYVDWLKSGIEPTEKLIAVPERLDITESWTSALNNRPDWKQLSLEAKKLMLNRDLRSNQRLPEVNAFGGYGRSGLDESTYGSPTNIPPPHSARFGKAIDDIAEGVNPNWNAGVAVRVPFLNYEERYRFRAAQTLVKQIEMQLNKLRQDILLDVDNTMDATRASYERVGATHQARLYAELALDGGQKRLDAGVITSFEVLSLQKDLTAARSMEARALADYNQALMLLFYRDGTVLERNKISVNFN